MTIDETFRLTNYILGKNQNGNVTPDNFNLLVATSNTEYKSFLIGQVEQFQYNSPKARIDLGNNEKVLSKLSPFIPAPLTLTIDGSGNAPYPNDYEERVALYTSTMQEIRWAAQQKLAAYLTDPIDPVATNPIYVLQKEFFQFYPITLGTAKLSYIQKGATPYWGYNQAGSILTLSGLTGGATYTNGTYTNVPLRGGYGIQALATIVVSGNAVSSVTVTNSGANFVVGDILTTPNTNIGGTGTGFSIQVASVSNYTRAVYSSSTSQDLLWRGIDQMEIVARILKKVGVNLQPAQVGQYASEIKTIGV